MKPIYRTADIRKIEQAFSAANPGVSLMERAGLAAAEQARGMLGDGYRVLVVCGPGNNGGDGLVLARHLRDWGYRVTTTLLGDAAQLPADAAAAHRAFVAAGGAIAADLPTGQALAGWDLIVDALFGIGLKRPLEGVAAHVVEGINGSGCKVLALDIPSGLDSDSGSVRGVAVRATETIAFIGLKPGLTTADAADYCGRVSVARLGIEGGSLETASGWLLDRATVATYLPRRPANSHKGSFGSVGILGGAEGMQGAAALAGRAALKLGAGRVYLGALGRLTAGYDPVQPELMWRKTDDVLSLEHLNVVVVGPGLGMSGEARLLLARAMELSLPLVLDADALNLVASHEPLQPVLATRTAPTILTPHPAEAARLLDSDTWAVQGNRVDSALEIAAHFHATVVLKGAGSIVALHDGRWYVNPTGNPGMASAGMGDVLSGMIGALLAQGLEAGAAVQLAVYLHGAAADQLVKHGIGPVGLVAGETIDAARQLVNTWVEPDNLADR